MQYVHTKDNVADDPTRNLMPREPTEPEPEWWGPLMEGDFSKLDQLLEVKGLHDAAIARWPPDDVGDAECHATAAAEQSTSRSTVLASGGERDAECREAEAPEQSSTRSTVLDRTGRDEGRRRRSVAVVNRFEPWLPRRRLTDTAVALLREVPRSQFVLPRGVKLDDVMQYPGHLDLFSGCRVAAKELAERSGRWVLTYDVLHSPAENLLDSDVQAKIWKMLVNGCFLTLTAGPVCASFSRAVRPPVRTAAEPAGIQNMTANMRKKVDDGNAMSRWLAELVRQALQLLIKVWIENPAGSFLWRQAEWVALVDDFSLQSFVTDYCRWGMRWRKRTRFLGVFSAAGSRCLCLCSSPHVKLTGYSKEFRCCWTKAAEAYPRSLAKFLAAALVESLKPVARQRHFDPASCAKAGECRIGEAKNPGPRQATQLSGDLEAVQLVQPSTIALQAKVHKIFLDWLQQELSAESWRTITESPQLQVLFVRSFGGWLFKQGRPIYLYRHLVVFLQQQFPALRQHTTSAWELLQKWEVLLPVSHRPPLPKVVLDAMVCLALTWGWPRWAALTMLAYHGACRVGEPLQARPREDMLLEYPSPKTWPTRSRENAAHKDSSSGNSRTGYSGFSRFATTGFFVSVISFFISEKMEPFVDCVADWGSQPVDPRMCQGWRSGVFIPLRTAYIKHSLDYAAKEPANVGVLSPGNSGSRDYPWAFTFFPEQSSQLRKDAAVHFTSLDLLRCSPLACSSSSLFYCRGRLWEVEGTAGNSKSMSIWPFGIDLLELESGCQQCFFGANCAGGAPHTTQRSLARSEKQTCSPLA